MQNVAASGMPTSTPKRRISRSVMSTYGRDTSAVVSATVVAAVTAPRATGSAINSADRNWLDTSPRTGMRPPACPPAAPIASGG